MQDYVTQLKRRVIAKSYHSTPPPQSRKTNAVFLSAMANGATQYVRYVAPYQGAWGGASGGATYSSQCCLSNGNAGAPGVFQTTTPENRGTNFNNIPFLGVKSIAPTS